MQKKHLCLGALAGQPGEENYKLGMIGEGDYNPQLTEETLDRAEKQIVDRAEKQMV